MCSSLSSLGQSSAECQAVSSSRSSWVNSGNGTWEITNPSHLLKSAPQYLNIKKRKLFQRNLLTSGILLDTSTGFRKWTVTHSCTGCCIQAHLGDNQPCFVLIRYQNAPSPSISQAALHKASWRSYCIFPRGFPNPNKRPLKVAQGILKIIHNCTKSWVNSPANCPLPPSDPSERHQPGTQAGSAAFPQGRGWGHSLPLAQRLVHAKCISRSGCHQEGTLKLHLCF